MGINRRSRNQQITHGKLRKIILEFLDKHEADMTADYQPESEQWRQQLAIAMTQYIMEKTKWNKT